MKKYIITYLDNKENECQYIKESNSLFSLFVDFAEHNNGKDDLFVTAINSINFNDVNTFIKMYEQFYYEELIGVYEIKKTLYEVINEKPLS